MHPLPSFFSKMDLGSCEQALEALRASFATPDQWVQTDPWDATGGEYPPLLHHPPSRAYVALIRPSAAQDRTFVLPYLKPFLQPSGFSEENHVMTKWPFGRPLFPIAAAISPSDPVAWWQRLMMVNFHPIQRGRWRWLLLQAMRHVLDHVPDYVGEAGINRHGVFYTPINTALDGIPERKDLACLIKAWCQGMPLLEASEDAFMEWQEQTTLTFCIPPSRHAQMRQMQAMLHNAIGPEAY